MCMCICAHVCVFEHEHRRFTVRLRSRKRRAAAASSIGVNLFACRYAVTAIRRRAVSNTTKRQPPSPSSVFHAYEPRPGLRLGDGAVDKVPQNLGSGNMGSLSGEATCDAPHLRPSVPPIERNTRKLCAIAKRQDGGGGGGVRRVRTSFFCCFFFFFSPKPVVVNHRVEVCASTASRNKDTNLNTKRVSIPEAAVLTANFLIEKVKKKIIFFLL